MACWLEGGKEEEEEEEEVHSTPTGLNTVCVAKHIHISR